MYLNSHDIPAKSTFLVRDFLIMSHFTLPPWLQLFGLGMGTLPGQQSMR